MVARISSKAFAFCIESGTVWRLSLSENFQGKIRYTHFSLSSVLCFDLTLSCLNKSQYTLEKDFVRPWNDNAGTQLKQQSGWFRLNAYGLRLAFRMEANSDVFLFQITRQRKKNLRYLWLAQQTEANTYRLWLAYQKGASARCSSLV